MSSGMVGLLTELYTHGYVLQSQINMLLANLFFQVGLSTPDDIGFDLRDLKFYDIDSRVLTYQQVFSSNSSNRDEMMCLK